MYQHKEDVAPATWLFGHVFGEASGWLVAFTGRQARLDDPDSRQNELSRVRQRSFWYPDDASSAAGYLVREAARERDAYFGTHLFRESGSRLRTNATGAMRCLWLDEDGGHYPESGPEPTAIVWSSGNRRHLYWALTRPLSAEWVVRMNQRIAAWSGGDSGKAALATVLRVPGTLNFKRHPRVDPVQLEITGAGAWEPEVLEQAVPLAEPPEPESRCHRPEHYDGPPIEIAAYLDLVEILAEVPDGLSGTKYAIVCPWVKQHSAGDRSGTYVGQRAGGGLWFHCHHDNCQGRDWIAFRRQCKRDSRTRQYRGYRRPVIHRDR